VVVGWPTAPPCSVRSCLASWLADQTQTETPPHPTRNAPSPALVALCPAVPRFLSVGLLSALCVVPSCRRRAPSPCCLSSVCLCLCLCLCLCGAGGGGGGGQDSRERRDRDRADARLWGDTGHEARHRDRGARTSPSGTWHCHCAREAAFGRSGRGVCRCCAAADTESRSLSVLVCGRPLCRLSRPSILGGGRRTPAPLPLPLDGPDGLGPDAKWDGEIGEACFSASLTLELLHAAESRLNTGPFHLIDE
jgi:hypothetical protein